MNILLINPWRPSLYESAEIIIPPVGLMYIAAVLRNTGHVVEIKDRVSETTRLNFSGVDLVGITAYASTYNLAIRIARQAHEAGLPVVMGGPQVTFTYREALGSGAVDYVIMGEGEKTIVDLVEALSYHHGKMYLNKIPGLAWSEDGQIFVNAPRPPLLNLDELPLPARELVDLAQYHQTTLDGKIATPVMTSRGCPYRCNFCVVPNLPQRKWRARSPLSVVEEIEQVMRDYNIQAFIFIDDNITINIPRIKELCQLIIERDLPITWWCMSRADTLVKHPDVVELMARAGCSTIFMGLESANEKVLADYNKKESVNTGYQAVQMLKNFGIAAYASFILGDPQETEQDIENTIDYAINLNPHVAQFSILTPYPGSAIFPKLLPRFITHNWDLFDGAHAVFRPFHLSAQRLESLLEKAYRKFYLRPVRLLKALKSYQIKSAIQVIKFLKKHKIITGRQTNGFPNHIQPVH